jgi:hypothetical protein
MAKLIGKAAGGFAAATLAAGAALTMAPTAHAGTTTGQAECSIPPEVRSFMGGKEKITGPQPYTVTGPASAAPGADIELNVDLGASPASSPVAFPGAKMTPTVEFKGSGASTATISGKADTFAMDLKANQGMDLPPFKVKVKVPADAKAGQKLDLTPAKLTLDVDAGLKINIPCTVTGAQVVHSITIGGSGGSAGSSTTSGSSSGTSGTSGSSSSGSGSSGSSSSGSGASGTSTTGSTTSGSLPKTGPLDDALSMGLVGGTVGLLGIGAVLIATRRVRNSRNAAS